MNLPFVPQVEVPVWSYTPPYVPFSHPPQRYYRPDSSGHSVHGFELRKECYLVPTGAPAAYGRVFWFQGQSNVELTLGLEAFAACVMLNLDSLTRLINALSDARYDLLQELERQRLSDSLREIREELDQRGGDGPGCYYGHPWVFYVAPGQAAAKCEELNAQGLAEYIVLEDADLASATATTEEAPAP